MINFDDYTNENKAKQFKMAMYSKSSIQNTYYWRFWITKNKYVIKFDKQLT